LPGTWRGVATAGPGCQSLFRGWACGEETLTDRIELPGIGGAGVRLRRHPRARRLTLRVSHVDGAATLTLPPWVGLAEARRFVAERAGWLCARRADLPARVPVGPGAVLPLGGVPLRIVAGQGRGIRILGETLSVPGPSAGAGARIRAFVIHRARADAVACATRHARALGRSVPPIRLADPRARWGSCSTDGRVMLSWRLAMAPDFVLDYVAAHEVAHLAHMDHSRAFWAVLARLYPDRDRARDWLKANGAALHRFDFTGD
jgi:predicted metal-dependent hydrolase